MILGIDDLDQLLEEAYGQQFAMLDLLTRDVDALRRLLEPFLVEVGDA